MRIDILGLQAFIAVVDQGSFGRAAKVLSISQTALSHRLKALEAQFGTRLIDRTTRSWTLTKIGERFYPRAKRLVEELRESFRELRDTEEGEFERVTVASIPMTAFELVPEAILRYSCAFPHNRVRLLELSSTDVLESVFQGRADIGVCVFARPHRDIEAEAVREVPYVLVCRDDHPLSQRHRVQWKDLEGQAIIALVNTGSAALLDRIFTELDFEVRVVHEAQGSTTALALAAAGLGLAILPKLAVNPKMYPQLRSIALDAPVIRRRLVMIRRKDVPLKSHVEPLYEEIRKALSR